NSIVTKLANFAENPLAALVRQLAGKHKNLYHNGHGHVFGGHPLIDKKTNLAGHEKDTVAARSGNATTYIETVNKNQLLNNEPGVNPNKTKTGRTEDTENSGDPVSLVTGEELLSLEETTLPGWLPVIWRRFYRTSAAELHYGLGYGWSHSFSQTLTFTATHILWHDQENRTVSFPFPSGRYTQINNPVASAMLCLGEQENEFLVVQGGDAPVLHFTRTGDIARLTTLSDSNGNSVAVRHSSDGLVQEVLSPAQSPIRRWRFISQVDAGDRHQLTSLVTERWVSDSWHPAGDNIEYQYNDVGQLIAATKGGETERYDYDSHNVILKRTLAGGAEFNWQWEGEGKSARCLRQWGNFDQLDEHYQWNDDTGCVTVTYRDGSRSVWQHDNQARLLKQVTPSGYETLYHYTEEGYLHRIIDGEGLATYHDYGSQGELRAVEYPDGRIVNYDWLFGQIYKITTGRKKEYRAWTFRRDTCGRLTEKTDPLGRLTRYEYNDQGKVTDIHYPDGSRRQFIWSGAGELLEDIQTPGAVRRFSYYPDGRLSQESDGEGNLTRYEYDAAGRLACLHLPDGATREYRYNAYGKVTWFRDERGQVTQYDYAAPLHLLTTKHLPNGTTLRYRYDNIHLQVSEIENQKGERYRLRYTPEGLLSEETGFDNVRTAYYYSANGHLTEKHEYGDRHDEAPLVTRYERDAAGRVSKKILPDGSEERYHYNYHGQLTEVTDSDGNALAWDYNSAGQLTAEHQNAATLRYRYGEETGLLTDMQLPDSQILGFHHHDGLLQGILLDNAPLVAFGYDTQGRVTERRQGNTLTSRFRYDNRSRLAGHLLREVHPEEFQPQTLRHQEYHYSPDGELLNISGDGARKYEYDPTGRLLAASHRQHDDAHHAAAAETFLYDLTGNRLSEPEPEAPELRRALNPGNRMTSYGDRRFEYDRFGNLITERQGKYGALTTYEYDCRHRLIKHTTPNGTVTTYTYDAFN
ncbi:DUF6531 domain-containing protein, partial [Phytobacter massiliensis]|uniref:DUF6531 domain-containing protein n=1 Tax=Phytobacter massiliensis TaxID=1485952 RepID=UPI001378B32F